MYIVQDIDVWLSSLTVWPFSRRCNTQRAKLDSGVIIICADYHNGITITVISTRTIIIYHFDPSSQGTISGAKTLPGAARFQKITDRRPHSVHRPNLNMANSGDSLPQHTD